MPLQMSTVSAGRSSQGRMTECTPDADAGEANKHIPMIAAVAALTVDTICRPVPAIAPSIGRLVILD